MLSDFSGDLGEEISQGLHLAFGGRSRKSPQRRTRNPRQYHSASPSTLLAGAKPSGKSLGRNPGKIFKNYALKSMDDVNAKLDEAAFYIERNPTLVKSITSFPYIAKSL